MVKFERGRRALMIALTSAALVACGRTGLGSLWGGTSASAGAFAVGNGATTPSKSSAGAAAVGQSGNAGRGGMTGSAGTAASVLGGAAGSERGGEGGTAGAVHALPACSRGRTPVLDGPLATRTEGPPAVSVADDWNGDDKLDLAVANTDGSVSVLLGNGDGSFASSVTYQRASDSMQGPGWWAAIATADLDGNGSLDLVLNQREGLRVFLGAGDGTFAPVAVQPFKEALEEFALGDFDGDRNVDIAVAANQAVVVLAGRGDGSFGSGVATPLGDRLKSISAGDLNQDGRLDLVVLTGSETAVLLGNGDGRFRETLAYEAEYYHADITLADFDADGHLDIVRSLACVRDGEGGRLELQLGNGDGTFSNAVWLGGGCAGRLMVADVNSDGAADLLPNILGQRTGNFLRLAAKVGGGALLGAGDWNGDGKPDLAAANDDGWITVHLGNGDGSFGAAQVLATAATPGSLALADFDADGELDVATTTTQYGPRGGADSSVLNVFRGVGDGTFFDRVDYQGRSRLAAPTAADLNGDGWLDLVTWARSNIAVHLGLGNARFAPEVTWPAGTDVSFAVGDLNGDGHPDIAAAIGSPKNLSLFFGTGDGTFAPITSIQLSDQPCGIAVVDANGDAKLDLVITLYESATLQVLLGDGNGAFAEGQRYSTQAASRALPADLNHDGNVDLVAWSRGSFSVYLGAGDGSFARRVDYERNSSELTAVDFDQDGNQDLLLAHEGGITLLLGAGDGTFACEARYLVGSIYALRVGDLNRDRRMDIAATSSAGINLFLSSTP